MPRPKGSTNKHRKPPLTPSNGIKIPRKQSEKFEIQDLFLKSKSKGIDEITNELLPKLIKLYPHYNINFNMANSIFKEISSDMELESMKVQNASKDRYLTKNKRVDKENSEEEEED
ncbi:hypothetical protein ACTFIR_012915 [Dictyostelium discoideum]